MEQRIWILEWMVRNRRTVFFGIKLVVIKDYFRLLLAEYKDYDQVQP